MKAKIWISGYLILVIGTLTFMGMQVVKVDPYFQYHMPNIDTYYYELDNQRAQNVGIIKNFKYDALITGTSMTVNFKTSEMDEIFGTNSVKIPYSGASYKEINDSLKIALDNNKNLKTIVRGLDMSLFHTQSDFMNFSSDYKYPAYLYDNNIFNDVNYIFNKDVIFSRVYPMVTAGKSDDFSPPPGITSFDAYSSWGEYYSYGINTVLSSYDDIDGYEIVEANHLTDADKEIIADNIYQNVTSLAEAHPDVTFYYFFTPYSALWWQERINSGDIYKHIETERFIIETILQVDNIKLYSFNNRTDITTDINNYMDTIHYGPWINSLILRWMYNGEGILTLDNYEEYLKELSFYTAYDYSQITNQKDYENDFYSEALFNEELNGVIPVRYSENMPQYLYNAENAELSLEIDNIKNYKYLVFYGTKKSEQDWPTASVYDKNSATMEEITANHYDTDDEWCQYLIDVSHIEGAVTIILNDKYSDIILY